MNYYGYVDIAIAFLFIILLLCIITSGINELIMHALKQRGTFLKKAITYILNDEKAKQDLSQDFYNHPVIDALKKNDKRPPSYISSDAFSAAIIDLVVRQYEQSQQQQPAGAANSTAAPTDALKLFQAGLEALKPSYVKTLLRSVTAGSADFDQLKKNLAKWFDDYMDRVSGWYKSKMQLMLFIIGFGVAVFLNVDTFRLLSDLNTNSTLRMQVADAAEQYMETHQLDMRNADSLDVIFDDIDSTYETLSAFDLPIGWNETEREGSENIFQAFWRANSMYFTRGEWFKSIIGWLVTAGFLSFGAPFWFQLLNKLIDLRKAGKKPQQANEEKG